MREPIPDLIAQEFLKNFLQAFTRGSRFDDAVKFSRQQLVDLETKYPYVSWLPVVIQNRLIKSPTWQSLGKIRSPYKGLAAFTEADVENFYGREDTIEVLADRVAKERFVPIIGASGSGKSSLIQAGSIPYLKQDPERDWQILTMRPGRNPFNALAKAISSDRSDLETIALDIDLASDPHLLAQKLSQIHIPQHRILLFIDQFEELFTQTTDESVHQIFLQSLANAVNNAPNFTLVFTLRNDFLHTLQSDWQNNDFRQLLEQSVPLLLGSMTRDRLQSAITKPVEKLGVEFEGGLVDRILQDIGINNASLPLLQLVLDRLWEQQQPRLITHQGYDAICGEKGIKLVLANRAEEIYGRFVTENKVKEFKQVFFRLVSIGDTTVTTRRIATRAEISEANWREIVLPLSTERLLINDLDEKTGVETVEIVHETLIKYWQRLQNWVAEYRDELEKIAEIETAARRWDKNNRFKQDLWQGKKLKAARQFAQNPERIVPLLSIVNIFLISSSKQQRSNKVIFVMLGLIVPGVAAWAYSIESNVAMFNNVPKKQCDRGRLLTSIQFLNWAKYPLIRLDFKERDLHCLNLSGLNLSNTNLSYANLSGVFLSDTNLSGINLSGANLSYANLLNVNLTNTNLSYANFRNAHLLNNVNLTNANLSDANLSDADLTGADLTNANLTNADLTGADLTGADLTNANLTNANLTNAQLMVADLTGADLTGADLTGANLTGANLSHANLSHANLTGARLSDTDLTNADLRGANLSHTYLDDADLTGANFINYENNGFVIFTTTITHEQLKLAKNWEKAKYSPEFRKKVGLK
jgi:uncharacterized protein YjbI with pentapeptide repeats/energy-coupling factor transporter ATP-binding protein EcfA2